MRLWPAYWQSTLPARGSEGEGERSSRQAFLVSVWQALLFLRIFVLAVVLSLLGLYCVRTLHT